MDRFGDGTETVPEPRVSGLRRVVLPVMAALSALAAAVWLFSVASTYRDSTAVIVRPAADLATLSPAEAEARAEDLTLWALERVYRAFEEDGEGNIYDALSAATAGSALEALYLQRRTALLDRGLEKTGQQVHELELLSASVRRQRDGLLVAARWRVLGLVGHEQHRHVRGNAYTADLRFERVDGQWRITTFDMREVDRTDAGVVVDAPAVDGRATTTSTDQ